MTITFEKTEEVLKEIAIVGAQYIDDFKILIRFSDDKENIVDFSYFLNSVLHPTLEKYRDSSNFKNFEIVDGNINWNDYEMIFPVWDLYEGEIK